MWVSASLFPPHSWAVHYAGGMRCVICRHEDTKVVDSRTAEDGAAIRRRRECPHCLHRFTTFERMDEVPLMVTKTLGGREPFERAKLISGVKAASKGRPIDDDAINVGRFGGRRTPQHGWW